MKSKHQEPTILSYCAHCDYKSPYKSRVISHMNTVHTARQTILHCFCQFGSNDECGIRNEHVKNAGMTGDEVRTLINDSFDVFQHYMKIKLQSTGNEEMIEENIDVFKCYMLKKINE